MVRWWGVAARVGLWPCCSPSRGAVAGAADLWRGEVVDTGSGRLRRISTEGALPVGATRLVSNSRRRSLSQALVERDVIVCAAISDFELRGTCLVVCRSSPNERNWQKYPSQEARQTAPQTDRHLCSCFRLSLSIPPRASEKDRQACVSGNGWP